HTATPTQLPAPTPTASDSVAAQVAEPEIAPMRPQPAAKLAREARATGQALARIAPQPASAPAWVAPPPAPEARERYQTLDDNPVHLVSADPVSTFSVDVDTGSYANIRRMLTAGQLPPADAVRVEEMINYFPYDYTRPAGEHPFAVHTELARSPWQRGNLLLRVALKGQDLAAETLPPANLVFLVDVSGSMHAADKLPLLKSALKLLVDRMRPEDRISLVTYASGTRVILEAAPGSDKARIANAIDALQAGGGTAGASGIELAYRMARQGHIEGGINRILLATDGDFNVGISDFEQLKSMVEERRRSGVSLSTLGFGTGNYNERLMEQMADVGDGAYSYIDTLMEAQKVLVSEMSSTLATIARDVKIQVEFNPAAVSEYRLIGYENRVLAREDFNNDQVDAGDIGAGHTVTALYELTPVGAPGLIDPLRYGGATEARPSQPVAAPAELAYVKLRYKRPGESASRLIEQPVARASVRDIGATSADFRFATAVAGFGQLLRGGRYTGGWRLADARAMAAGGIGNDAFGYRGEALRLMDLAAALSSRPPLAVQTRE
ncbi:MAG: VWA domain-containing protein, partial [Rhodocyclaceae bacterium]|nr:VWA domain-containing protein [Rhodocyclaceae bacterium]